VRALVTGAAGFIGSNLTDHLLEGGWSVRGIDNFSLYYSSKLKQQNLTRAMSHDRFSLVKADLTTVDLPRLLDGVDVVFHLAGQPGVRASWGDSFGEYLEANVLASQRLLEAIRKIPCIKAVVAASSSSVYGSSETFPTTEDVLPRPVSPYGVTKLAAEHLFSLYGREFGVPAVSLRFFTVYGPRQRPDMAIARLLRSALFQEPFLLNGEGSQERDFTYVQDVVEALMKVAHAQLNGELKDRVFNVGSENPISLLKVIQSVEEVCGKSIPIEFRSSSPGDPLRTGSDCKKIRAAVGWRAETRHNDGLVQQLFHTAHSKR
jgi:UDP-glucuronate 4-epimerase